ncbi:MAG: hypothetical protein J0H73_13320, partial [Salana multivorans]|nr:hypothetical protein [Salana multivorans]
MTPSSASPFRFPVRGRIAARAAATVTAAALVLGGCAAGQQTGQTEAASASSASSAAAAAAGTVWDASSVHTIEVEIDPDVLAGLLATYEDSSAKDWASATVTIDGQTFENVGIKLKGNSSLQGVTAESDPTSLPWRIRLDKYVDGQSLDGYTDFAVRPNGSESSFNEAVALDLLADAGLATEKAVATAFSVNGDDAVLRLTVQNLDEAWVADEFPDAG